MVRFGLARNGGSREYERIPLAASIDGVADGVPEGGNLLPLVDEAGVGALECLVGRQAGQFLVLEGPLGIEQAYFAVAETTRRPCLSAVFRTLDAYSAEVFHIFVNESIENPRFVACVDEVSTLGFCRHCDH
jgi:hypothetical protein